MLLNRNDGFKCIKRATRGTCFRFLLLIIVGGMGITMGALRLHDKIKANCLTIVACSLFRGVK